MDQSYLHSQILKAINATEQELEKIENAQFSKNTLLLKLLNELLKEQVKNENTRTTTR